MTVPQLKHKNKYIIYSVDNLDTNNELFQFDFTFA